MQTPVDLPDIIEMLSVVSNMKHTDGLTDKISRYSLVWHTLCRPGPQHHAALVRIVQDVEANLQALDSTLMPARISYTLQPFYTRVNESWYVLNRRLGGPQRQSGPDGEEKYPWHDLEPNPGLPTGIQSHYWSSAVENIVLFKLGSEIVWIDTFTHFSGFKMKIFCSLKVYASF